jgi:hypothetical protein
MVTFPASKDLTSRRPIQLETTPLAARALEPVAENTLSELRCSDGESEAGEDPRGRSGYHFAMFHKPPRISSLLDPECLVERTI